MKLCVICPITSQGKGYPFEVALPDGLSVHGVVLTDHVKSLSWEARKASFACTCPKVAPEVLGKVKALLGL